MQLRLGNYLPSETDLSTAKYPDVLGRSLFNVLKEGLRLRGEGLAFLPLFHFLYSDGAPMITIAGIVIDEANITKQRVEATGIFASPVFMAGENQVEITTPPLTFRERLALDGMMPSALPPTSASIKTSLGFEIDQSLLDNFHKLYRVYPTFGEISLP